MKRRTHNLSQRVAAFSQKAARRAPGLALLLLLVSPNSSLASIFGEENITLGAILAEVLQHTTQLQDTVRFVRQTTAFARDTASFTKESVQVARNVRTIIDHPAQFSLYLSRSWSQAFPDLQDIVSDIDSMRQSMRARTGSDGMAVYDPGAYARAFSDLQRMRSGSFEVMAHAVDEWGINDPHDASIAALRQMHEESAANLEAVTQAVAAKTLTPQDAAVHTAQAQALSAEAQIRTAATVERMARTLELQAVRALAAEAEAAGQDFRQKEDATQPHVRQWRLAPLGAPSPQDRRR